MVVVKDLLEVGLKFLADEDAFIRNHRRPWLVSRTPMAGVEIHVTGSIVPAKLLEDAPAPCFEVLKSSAGNAFPFGVTIGHTDNNDICLRDPSVSRFHAYIQNELTAPVLIDTGSKNGTFIRGELVPPRSPHLLAPGDEIRFGSFQMVFFDADDFLTYLRNHLNPPR